MDNQSSIKRKKVIEVSKDFKGPTNSVPNKAHPALLASNVNDLAILIRDAEESDVSFIFNSWLRSFRNGALCTHVANSVYFTEHHKILEKLLTRSNVIVACDPADASNVYGWLCFEHVQGVFVVHYAYVKQTFRNLGILNSLLDKTGHDFVNAGLYSHWNFHASKMAANRNLLYHPYILINYDSGAQTPSTGHKVPSYDNIGNRIEDGDSGNG